MYINYSDSELVYLAKEGIEEAKSYLFKKYTTLIMKIYSSSMYYKEQSLSDFVQEGLIVLEAVIESYDMTFTNSFYSYFLVCFKRRISRIKQYEKLNFDELVVHYGSRRSSNHSFYQLRYIINRELESEDELTKKIIQSCILENESIKKFSIDNNLDYKKTYYIYIKIRLKLEKLLTN